MPVRVDDSFNINKEGRMGGNGRRYVLHAVRNMLESPATQEGLRLGELYGYFGHGIRQATNKMRPSELEVVMLNGKPVAIQNVPSNRTVQISIDDDGTVHHTQEILDTPSGQIVQSMIDSGAGGWSWACSGATSGGADYPNSFFGFDYVNQPNFVPLDRQRAMFESVGVDSVDALIAYNLQQRGIECDKAFLDSWNQIAIASEATQNAELDVFMLSGMLLESKGSAHNLKTDLEAARAELAEREKQRETLILESLDQFPVMLSAEQRRAMAAMNTPEDAMIFRQFLESVSGIQLSSLPLGAGDRVTSVPRATSSPKKLPAGSVIFGQKFKGFK